MCCRIDDYVTGIVISVWTVIQTGFHVSVVVSGHFFYGCKIVPSNYLELLVYLTYFYNYTCDFNGNGRQKHIFDKLKLGLIPLYSNTTEGEDNVYDIINTIYEKAVLPQESAAAGRTQMYIFIYVISDGIWVIAAILLFLGSYFKVKKGLSLLFFGPWLLSCGLIILLDVTSAVQYGLDLRQIHNYTSWLKFIGVMNYRDFTKFNKYGSSLYIPQGSSLLIIVFLSRFLIFWIMNIAGFYHILNVAIVAYQDDPGKVNRSKRRGNPRSILDTSESRIRNWQLFYGAIETTSTVSGNTNSSLETDHNSNSKTDRNSIRSKSRDVVGPIAQSSQCGESPDSNIECISSIKENSKTFFNVSSHYTKFSDVADVIGDTNLRKGSIDSLRGQLPWSYTKASSEHYNMAEAVGSSSTMKNRQERTENNTKSTAL